MKKPEKKLTLHRSTIRTLQAMHLVAAGRGPQGTVTGWYACPTDETCGGSHAPTCGDLASRCEC